MMAMYDAKEGFLMFAEWISSWRREPPAADPLPAPSPLDPAAVQSLAAGVQQLCGVCEDLLALAVRSELHSGGRGGTPAAHHPRTH